jgi:hypothetical protein
MALDFGDKIENGGATAQGKFTADELNQMVSAINSNTAGKFGYQRISVANNGDNVLQVFADADSCKKYDVDSTAYASLLLSSIVLPSGGTSTGISYYLRCVNNLSTLSMSVAKNDECLINFTFISKYAYDCWVLVK